MFFKEGMVEGHPSAIFLLVQPLYKDLPVFGRHQLPPKNNRCLDIHLFVGVSGHLSQQFKAVLNHPASL